MVMGGARAHIRPLGRRRDAALTWATRLCAVIAGALTLLVFAFLVGETLPLCIKLSPHHLLVDARWAPRDGSIGLFPMMAGSAFVVGGAMLLSTPLGVAVAALSAFFAPRSISLLLRGVLGILAGVPSVVYGLWGLTVLVPLIHAVRAPGVSLLAGILVLGLMILPTMALLADAALRAVPVEQMRAAAALGLSDFASVLHVALPCARGALATASILQVGRAVGETMAVIMVMGNTIQIPSSPFDPARALTAHIALEMGYAMGDHRRALFAAGLLLLVTVATLVTLVDRVESRRRALP